ncbi:alcohol dehydrogenase class-3 chain H-like [Siniperca chuatsi]|uniref:alcohol dehydrogenase class-3 chain H-like n=1 Tax=Siniperca chuatsi TaxID=119488 RepID=UPI001CE1A95C|nr:alcohol dehydrogenase class-3 chain H-like [Siniperca chuatsi]
MPAEVVLGSFPCSAGPQAGASKVESVAKGVTKFQPGDTVIPLYIPQFGECKFCTNPKTNLCQKIRLTQGRGLMPDGSTPFSCKGKSLFHFKDCITFSKYTVVAEISLAKVDPRAHSGQGLSAGLRHHHWSWSCSKHCQGYKSVDSVPKLVEEYMNMKLKVDEFVTHTLPFLRRSLMVLISCMLGNDVVCACCPLLKTKLRCDETCETGFYNLRHDGPFFKYEYQYSE